MMTPREMIFTVAAIFACTLVVALVNSWLA
jgi:hypothetical protein